MSADRDFVKIITAEWTTLIESVEVDGFNRPVEKVRKHIDFERCYLSFILEDLSQDDRFIPIDENTKKTYRKWGDKLVRIFENILGEKDKTVPNSSFTEFKFRSGWGESLEYSVWRLSIVFNIPGMMAKHRERKIDELLNGK